MSFQMRMEDTVGQLCWLPYRQSVYKSTPNFCGKNPPKMIDRV